LAGTAGLQVGSVIFTVNGGQVTGLTDFAKLVTVTDPSILRMSVALNPATPPLTRTNVTLTRP
jgi:S1-C subfamily serine protease